MLTKKKLPVPLCQLLSTPKQGRAREGRRFLPVRGRERGGRGITFRKEKSCGEKCVPRIVRNVPKRKSLFAEVMGWTKNLTIIIIQNALIHCQHVLFKLIIILWSNKVRLLSIKLQCHGAATAYSSVFNHLFHEGLTAERKKGSYQRQTVEKCERKFVRARKRGKDERAFINFFYKIQK